MDNCRKLQNGQCGIWENRAKYQTYTQYHKSFKTKKKWNEDNGVREDIFVNDKYFKVVSEFVIEGDFMKYEKRFVDVQTCEYFTEYVEEKRNDIAVEIDNNEFERERNHNIDRDDVVINSSINSNLSSLITDFHAIMCRKVDQIGTEMRRVTNPDPGPEMSEVKRLIYTCNSFREYSESQNVMKIIRYTDENGNIFWKFVCQCCEKENSQEIFPSLQKILL